MKLRLLGAVCALIVCGIYLPANAALVQNTFTTTVEASIYDNPRNGVGDGFNTDNFVLQTPSREDRVILEFDISPLDSSILSYAQLSFYIGTNNGGGAQYREFDLYLYSGDGNASLSDFGRNDIYVTRIGYTVYNEVPFNIDVSGALQQLIDSNAAFSGVLIDPIGDQNFASVVCGPAGICIPAYDQITLTTYSTVVPLPAAAWLFASGFLGLIGIARRTRSS